MTKELLEEYLSKLDEIKELEEKIENLKESTIGNDVIMDYRTGYPRPQSVIAVDQEKYFNLRKRYEKSILQLKLECQQVEEFIDGIRDSKIRRIFRMYYMEGKKQEEISAAVHVERSYVSKKIDKYLKDSHNSHNSHL